MASKSINIAVDKRSNLGSRANRKLRQSGKIPGVVYGHKEAVVPVSLNRKEISSHLSRGAHVFDLALDGKSEKVLVKEVQFDHLGIEPVHIDFARVSLDERVKITVSIELKGTPKGEAEGAVLQQIMSEIEVECLVTDIPDVIRHSVADMEKDSVLHIKELTLPPGVKALHDPAQIVAQVREILEEAPAAVAAEAGAAEPEVIGKKKEDEAAPAEGEEKK